jgi:hypothetical protein
VCAPSVRRGFFPLDEELELWAGHFTPSVYEGMTRLGTWMPFKRAVKEMKYFGQVSVTEATVRRTTEEAGAAYVAVQTAEVERLECTLPPAPAGPALQLLSVDGAFVPLVHQEWTEVKTLAVGTVGAPVLEKGERVVHTTDLSYFSRLAEAEAFERLALVETHRRGTETAQQVCAVTDGAEWEQGFIDHHREDAVRILDFSHAAEYVAAAGQAVLGEGTPVFHAWLKDTLHQLKHGQPDQVLTTLRARQVEARARGSGGEAAVETIQKSLTYLEKRQDHLHYAEFQALGYPIGSGSVESANKLVVEARMKGAGMHWARSHVDPMVALRNVACNDRWEEAWPQITAELRRQAAQHRVERRHKRTTRCDELPTLMEATAVTEKTDSAPTPLETPLPPASLLTPPPTVVSEGGFELETPLTPASLPAPVASAPSAPKTRWRPDADHPWRHDPIGKARYRPAQPKPAKL